jgi:hypothetical protein
LAHDRRKSPKLMFLDISPLDFSACLQGRFFEHRDLYAFY